jgi:hypothetical protein
VHGISYRPTDLSLLKEFSKNVSFSNSYKLPSQSAVQKISMSTVNTNSFYANFTNTTFQIIPVPHYETKIPSLTRILLDFV